MVMSERVQTIVQLLLVIVGVGLVVYGHQPTDKLNLMVQIVGLALILVALYLYNKKYQ